MKRILGKPIANKIRQCLQHTVVPRTSLCPEIVQQSPCPPVSKSCLIHRKHGSASANQTNISVSPDIPTRHTNFCPPLLVDCLLANHVSYAPTSANLTQKSYPMPRGIGITTVISEKKNADHRGKRVQKHSIVQVPHDAMQCVMKPHRWHIPNNKLKKKPRTAHRGSRERAPINIPLSHRELRD